MRARSDASHHIANRNTPMPSSRTKPRIRFFALSLSPGWTMRDDDREEQAGDGSRARGDGDRHVEPAPVKPGRGRGDRGADAADRRRRGADC